MSVSTPRMAKVSRRPSRARRGWLNVRCGTGSSRELPCRSTSTRRYSANVPGTYARVPSFETSKWAAPVTLLVSRPSRTGNGTPVTWKLARLNGTAMMVAARAYTRCPLVRYRASVPPLRTVERTPVSRRWMASCASSKMPPRHTVNSTAFPPGRRCGHRCASSPLAVSSAVTGCGVPPAAGMRERPLVGLPAKMMESSSPQVAPNVAGAAASVVGAPPATGTFFSCPFAENPSHRPSGEKKGSLPPSVPGRGCACSWLSGRTKICVFPRRAATYARRLPSGDMATARCTSRARSWPGSAVRGNRETGPRSGTRPLKDR